jgi:hypothetical protein
MALPALPSIGIGIMTTYFGLLSTNPVVLLSLAGLGLTITVAGIVFGFVNYKTDAAKKAEAKASSAEATSP